MTPTDVTTRPEWLAFLRAILTEPGEDVHRLVAADWFEEHGEPERAEFIRVQVELASPWPRRHSPGCPRLGYWKNPASRPAGASCRRCRQPAATRRERELLRESYRWLDARDIDLVVIDDHGPDSLLVLGQERPGRPWTIQARLERGFVAELRCPAEAFLKHADALIWHPKQTVDCPECADVEHNYPMHMQAEMFSRCSCSGTGSVARTCPPTAQPITKVTLTTAPAYEFPNDGRTRLLGRAADHWVPRGEGHDHSVRGVAKTLCELEWPGVEFEISSGPLAY